MAGRMMNPLCSLAVIHQIPRRWNSH